ncbi:katanin p80 WD40 repeat-containing subunit B1-like [Biomphalaria glabrata]|uniref:Katanin p80 WD40 repeat-containing subunit B1 n=2 Tax=Biomphalaria glabrata TaxID=6526 RepID=A0A9W3AVE6_BIOGL|nr:katanin p80 WD40 repeat-containing subunit B1-like [Biomphalaria glabrata]KAI8762931.1 katanin p80 WD40 repeat-containing subunit B1-like [Biomphalaria glabrata]KAI8790713.1 katanin p80 WD40 repeat-containing subunit B1 [Biomphalaria glabrata]
MATTKKAWKLQDFVAHASDVKCLGLGHKSGRVMVTGGDDRKVNLWSVGKPHCIMSLTGHTTSIECVRFGHDEELVVAGSLSGALKVWDLEQAKILRTLTGHKAGIKSLDFHPYGNYVASGSMDCNVKLWDIRRKGCIYTYKGHTNCVNCLRFTPDGQWIASASEDNTIKIWDLTAGKLLTELKLHRGPVNTVEYHPSDLLLASGSSDKTVKFWDLETFQCISSSDTDKHPVRSLIFHPEGTCLYSGCEDSLKVYGWEPFVCHDVVPVSWSEVADLAITSSQLIAASFTKTNVSTFVVDLNKVAPTGAVSKSDDLRTPPRLTSSSGRRSFITDRPPTSSSRETNEPKRSDTPPDSKDKERPDVNDEDGASSQADIQDQDDYRRIFKENARNPNGRQRVEPFQPPPDDDMPDPVKVTAPSASVKKEISPRIKPVQQQKPSVRESFGCVQPADFLPKQKAASDLNENEILDMLNKGHNTMMTVLIQRSRNLQVVRAMWTSGNTKTAIDSALSMKDPAVMVDLLSIINTRATLWSLDLCNLLLPQLKELMSSKYESHVMAAANAVKLVLKNFGHVIKGNMEEPPSSFVDISREERHKKCLACYTCLSSIKSLIQASHTTVTPKMSAVYREIMLLMVVLD